MSDTGEPVARRIGSLDWTRIEGDLDRHGCALTGPLLTSRECALLRAGYEEEHRFRSRVVMDRHGFGSGEYKYFAYPLPRLVAVLRRTLYAPLARIANAWAQRTGAGVSYPPRLDEFTARCHAAGQKRPTPLLLKYGAGDYNCLHQDLYGPTAFPLQATFLLDRPEVDFEGGEFVLVEQRPRMQSRAEVVPLEQGGGVIFAVNRRPVQGRHGPYAVTLRHGVSRLRRGRRHTLGVIFHDAA